MVDDGRDRKSFVLGGFPPGECTRQYVCKRGTDTQYVNLNVFLEVVEWPRVNTSAFAWRRAV